MRTESDDGVAFATVSEDKEDSKKSGKKKEIRCFMYKKSGIQQASLTRNRLPKQARQDLTC